MHYRKRLRIGESRPAGNLLALVVREGTLSQAVRTIRLIPGKENFTTRQLLELSEPGGGDSAQIMTALMGSAVSRERIRRRCDFHRKFRALVREMDQCGKNYHMMDSHHLLQLAQKGMALYKESSSIFQEDRVRLHQVSLRKKK